MDCLLLFSLALKFILDWRYYLISHRPLDDPHSGWLVYVAQVDDTQIQNDLTKTLETLPVVSFAVVVIIFLLYHLSTENSWK